MMKRCLLLVCFGVLLCGLLMSTASAAVQAGYCAVVNNPNPSDRLNLRESPSDTSRSLGKFYNGCVVSVQYITGDWAYVEVSGEVGFMRHQYLADAASPVMPAMPIVPVENAKGAVLTMSGGGAALHLPRYAAVTLLGVRDQTAYVQYGGKTGTMNLAYLYLQEQGNMMVTPKPSVPAATPEPFVFTGPAGYYETAQWPLNIVEYTAAVNNPDLDDRLNLRTGPGRDYPSLGKYYNGVQVVINGAIEPNEKGEEWVKVSVCGLDGYMENRFLAYERKDYPVSVLPVMQVKNPNSARNLNLRQEQTVQSASLGVYPNGTRVILMGFTGEWAHVIVEGQTGFMMAKYLK